MAIGQTTSAHVAPLPREIIDRNLLERALDYLPHALFAQTKPIPQNSGDQPSFTLFQSLPNGVLLQEGVNPEPYRMERQQVTGQLISMGAYVEITDWLKYISQDKLQIEARQLLGESAGKTLDTYIRDILCAGTAVYRADEAATRDAIAATPDADDLDDILLALRNNKAEPFTRVMNPSTGVGTTPIADAYWGITTFDAIEHFRGLTGWVDARAYPTQSGVQRNEMGAYRNIRFIASTNARIFEGAGSGAADVHTALILGKNAYGICPLTGKSLENIEKTPQEIGGPLSQYGTSGYKMTTCAMILNQNFMYRYEFLV